MVIRYSIDQLKDFNNSSHRLDTRLAKYIRSVDLSKHKKTHRGSKGSKNRIPIKISDNSLIRKPCISGQGVNNKNLLDINISTKNCNHGLNIASFNARSVRNKTLFLRDFIIDDEIDILCLNETWLQENELSIAKEIAPDGFSIKNLPRPNGRGGGILLIYRSNLKIRFNESEATSFESLSCTISFTNKILDLLVIYRPPPNAKNGFTNSLFIEEFSDLITDSHIKPHDFILTGDLNVHFDNANLPIVSELNTILESLDLKQNVRESTHSAGHVLDVVIGRNSDKNCNDLKVKDIGLSDHKAILMSYNVEKQDKMRKTVISRNLKSISVEGLKK